LDLTEFFQKQEIDVFSEVSLDDLSDEDRSSVVQFFPAARYVIVFGKEVPVPVYRMPPKEKTRGSSGLQRLWTTLLSSARLSGRVPGRTGSAVPAGKN
jgi:hypothetical protein